MRQSSSSREDGVAAPRTDQPQDQRANDVGDSNNHNNATAVNEDGDGINNNDDGNKDSNDDVNKKNKNKKNLGSSSSETLINNVGSNNNNNNNVSKGPSGSNNNNNNSNNNSNSSNTSTSKGESHRIYWQQWLIANNNNNTTTTTPSNVGTVIINDDDYDFYYDDDDDDTYDRTTTNTNSNNNLRSSRPRPRLITSSAAVRIAPGNAARAIDVTKLLRETLNLTSSTTMTMTSTSTTVRDGLIPSIVPHHDSLVLVGTLHSLPNWYVQYEHEVVVTSTTAEVGTGWNGNGSMDVVPTLSPLSSSPLLPSSLSLSSEPFHVVRTLKPSEHPLQVRVQMVSHLNKLWQRHIGRNNKNVATAKTSTTTTTSTTLPPPAPPLSSSSPSSAAVKPTIKTQWYFVPGVGSGGPSIIPSCIELEGYVTDMDDDDNEDDDNDDDDDDDDNTSNSHSNNDDNDDNDDYNDNGNDDDDDDNEDRDGYDTERQHWYQQQDDDDHVLFQSTPTLAVPSNSLPKSSLPPYQSPLHEDYKGFPAGLPLSTTSTTSSSLTSTFHKWSISSSLSSRTHQGDDGTLPAKASTKGTTSNVPTGRKSTLPSLQRQRQRQRWDKSHKKDLRRYLQISNSHTTNPNTLAGYLLKQSNKDPHVWKRVYCVLTEDYLWYIHRCCCSIPPPSNNDSTDNASTSNNKKKEQNHPPIVVRMASKRGRIRLSRALLMEPDKVMSSSSTTITSTANLYPPIPHSFSVVNGKGITHWFRSTSGRLSKQWRHAIALRITEAIETTTLLQSAELIVTDETMARNARWTALAVHPLLLFSSSSSLSISSQWRMESNKDNNADDNDGAVTKTRTMETSFRQRPDLDLPSSPQVVTRRTTSKPLPPGLLWNNKNDDVERGMTSSPPLTPPTPFATQVLRLGMAIAEYREGCRHIQALLWSEAGGGGGSLVRTTSGTMMAHPLPSNPNGRGGMPSSLDPPTTSSLTRKLVQGTWEEASDLLAQATQVAMQVQVGGTGPTPRGTNDNANKSSSRSNSKKQHLSRSLETLCRHIDYVLTGQFSRHASSSIGGNSSTSGSTGNNIATRPQKHNDPPPMDLFDLLLAELQTVAREQMSSSNSGSTTSTTSL